jgi:hypothetical protein
LKPVPYQQHLTVVAASAAACAPGPYTAATPLFSFPLPAVEGADPIPLPLYLLGSDAQGRWTFALDISSAAQAFLQFLAQGCELEVALKDMRVLLPGLSLDAAAIAGQAAALSQWHQVSAICTKGVAGEQQAAWMLCWQCCGGLGAGLGPATLQQLLR